MVKEGSTREKHTKVIICCRGPSTPPEASNVPYYYNQTQTNTQLGNYINFIAYNGTGTIMVANSNTMIYFYSYINGQY